MKTTELIKAIRDNSRLTSTEIYNLLVADLFDFVPQEQVEQSQRLVAYFMYKIQDVLVSVIHDLQTAGEGGIA